MKFTTVLSALAMFVAATQASYMSYSSPKKGEKWTSGKSNDIKWDKDSIKGKGKMSLHLCKSGSVDLTEIITTIAVSVDNSGSYSWSPPSSLDISIQTVVIIIVDSSNNYYNSDDFYVYKDNNDYKGNDNKGNNNDDYKSKSKSTKEYNTKTYANYHNFTTSTKTHTVTKTTKYETVSTVTLPGNTYTTVIQITKTLTSCFTTPAVETQPPPATIPEITYQVPPPVAVTSYQSEPIYTLSNTTTFAPPPAPPAQTGFFTTADASGTTVGPASPVFTAAASTFSRNLSLIALAAVAGFACLF